MQDLLGFLTYLWSVGGTGILVFVLGTILQEISEALERPVIQGIKNEWISQRGHQEGVLELTGVRKSIYERYKHDPEAWNRIINILYISGGGVIIISGFVLVTFIGFIMFFMMKYPLLRSRFKRPDVKDRLKDFVESGIVKLEYPMDEEE
ncbi:MAG: hypothetical protein EAX81_06460 [Candidatus Thorarchaeota archaeon]|nr:hypothetical protein [Candidatus Thorarchaeota archaeon]